ncbi:MAG: integrase [Desulfurococcales archaeon]|nr:integrase [Desulfurococcales archaeon]
MVDPPSDGRLELWETWCLERGASPETCAKYASYLERPLDPQNRWSAKAYKLYLRWLCEEHGHQESCDAYKRLKVPQAGADKRVPSLEAVMDSIRRAGPYRLLYMILLESGLRLVEAVKLIREHPSLECTRLDGFERCLLGYTRGKKRALWGYHITPITSAEDLTDRRATSYAEKYKLVPPKHVRKFVATKMAELGVPFEVIDFIQGRAPRSVLLQHYAQLLGVADREYARYAAWLRRVYREHGLEGGD